jgi:hypothetical protein
MDWINSELQPTGKKTLGSIRNLLIVYDLLNSEEKSAPKR